MAAADPVAYDAVFVVFARCVSATSVVASFIIFRRLIIRECGVPRGIAARCCAFDPAERAKAGIAKARYSKGFYGSYGGGTSTRDGATGRLSGGTKCPAWGCKTDCRVLGRGKWVVEAMVVGEGEAADGGARGMRGVPHANAQGTAPMEVFQAVKWDASIFEGVGEGELNLQTYPLLGSRAAHLSPPWPACVVPVRCKDASRQLQEEEVARHVLEFLRRHRAMVVRVSGIGAREGMDWRSSSRRHLPGQPSCTS